MSPIGHIHYGPCGNVILCGSFSTGDYPVDQKISITPGPVFSSTGQYQNFIRLNYGFPWQPSSEQAVETLASIITSWM